MKIAVFVQTRDRQYQPLTGRTGRTRIFPDYQRATEALEAELKRNVNALWGNAVDVGNGLGRVGPHYGASAA